MKYRLLIFLVFLAFRVNADADWFEHKIDVPEEFRGGRSVEMVGTSDIERYVTNYEKTWWKVLRAFYSGEYDWRSPEHFSICSGNPAASIACVDGYEAAKKRLNNLILAHGEAKLKEAVGERLNDEI